MKSVRGYTVPDLAVTLRRVAEWFTNNLIQPVHLFDDPSREVGVVSVADRQPVTIAQVTGNIPGAATELIFTITCPNDKRWRFRGGNLYNNTNASGREIGVKKDASLTHVLYSAGGIGAGSLGTPWTGDFPVSPGMAIHARIYSGLAGDACRFVYTYQEETIP